MSTHYFGFSSIFLQMVRIRKDFQCQELYISSLDHEKMSAAARNERPQPQRTYPSFDLGDGAAGCGGWGMGMKAEEARSRRSSLGHEP